MAKAKWQVCCKERSAATEEITGIFLDLSFTAGIQSRAPTAIETLAKIAESDKATDAARVSACVALLDRGWGKPIASIA
jgi:hypothetical protein